MLRSTLFAAVTFFLGLASAALANVPQIPGWSLSRSDGGLAMYRNCGGGADPIVYGIYPAFPVSSDGPEKWLESQVNYLSSGWTTFRGEVTGRSAIAWNAPMLFQTITFNDSSGAPWSGLIMGHPMARLGQIYAIVTPITTPEDDPGIQTAIQHAITLMGQNFALDPKAFTQTLMRDPGPSANAGQILLTLNSSQLRWFTKHRLDTERRKVFISGLNRFFEDKVSDYAVQGRVVTLGENTAASVYELKYGDGSIDLIPATCGGLSPDMAASIKPTSTATPSPTTPPTTPGARNCRTVPKEEFAQRTATRCDWRGVCGTVTESDVKIVETEICD
jgi:hypothetical protein